MTPPTLAEALQGKSREEIARFLASYSDADVAWLTYDWRGFWARPGQIAPEGDWSVWLVLAGRGYGKTRVGAEWVREQKEKVGRIALVAPTAADARDVMVEGESGVLAISPPWDLPVYEPSKRRVTWRNGSMATLYSADEPDRLRGPNHGAAWCDELAAWRYGREAWDNLMLGLRIGAQPRAVVTTTPRPLTLLRELVKARTTRISRGSTYENLPNLAPAFASTVLSRYEGTRLGRQELHAELLDELPGALWNRAMLDQNRVSTAPELVRVVVAVDPAATSGEESDETGIVVAGVAANGDGFVLDDLSCRESPDGWARRAVGAYHQHQADRIVAETNNGGEMVAQVIRTVDPKVSYSGVHASRGKVTRAEPVAALYEQGRIHHVGTFAQLEDQQCAFTPQGYRGSPDRVDALCWAITELMLDDEPAGVLRIDPTTLNAGFRPSPWELQ